MTWGGSGTSRQGFDFKVSKRPHQGAMICMETEGSYTRVTPNHRVLARFNEDFENRWIVYLMRKGDWWRVGVTTSANRPYKSGGLGGRLATEQADDGWVLSVHDDRSSALVEEAFVQGYYGIPSLTFRASKGRALDNSDLTTIHHRTAAAVNPRALALLADRGLLGDSPMWSRSQKTNMRATFVTAAANLVALSGRFDVPVPTKAFVDGERGRGISPPELMRCRVDVSPFCGDVYGLDVPPYHHYVSGGAVVHNSVKGGQASVVYLMPDLSKMGMVEWNGQMGPDRRDGILRQMYVGMTRAKEELVICQPTSEFHVSPAKMLEGLDG